MQERAIVRISRIFEPWALSANSVLDAMAGTGVPCGTGSIPRELGELHRLEELHLENNKLSGEWWALPVRATWSGCRDSQGKESRVVMRLQTLPQYAETLA